jgi:hypothetical protein
VDEQLASRDEIVGLLFRVNDIAETLLNIEQLLRDEDGEEEEDEG